MSAAAATLTNPAAGLAAVAPTRSPVAAPTPETNRSPAGPSSRNSDTASFSTEAQEASEAAGNANGPRGSDGEPLSEEEQQQVRELQARDREVKAHEQAHKNAAGQYATSGPTYTYQTGPDGKRYAVGGSVGIDVSPEDTPEETLRKMEVVRRAALAPAEPSAQDRRVAAQATRTANQARQELNAQRAAEATGDTEDDPSADAATGQDTAAATPAVQAEAFRSQPNASTLIDLIA
ncbi:MAG: putative metalloprotease CJM1_0395 family protein [Planctomycetota bacterium]